MKLRFWQKQCVELALSSYAAQQQHFLCLATPGAGKTVMSSELAARLLESGQIDFVLCFAPSVSVVSGFIHTFEQRFDRRMDGKIGAAGGAYTYQAMLHLDQEFWSILQRYRVLVVFDEIHHCSGQNAETTNAWGETILLQIRDKATFSIAMTGTPWRSDEAPIVLARYLDPDNRLHCDYVYGLTEAVNDHVCRKPIVTMIDVSSVQIEDKTYDSLTAALNLSDLEYSTILHDSKAMEFALELGVLQLVECRKEMENAGGLIVASSIAHAKQLFQMLRVKFNQTAVMVTYKEVDPHNIIELFKRNNLQWIVSVGMVSEGTDIPRLQVCCHLSTVRTELYFRQILGRVLRKIVGTSNENGYLITFAEQSLLLFAERIQQEIPESEIRVRNHLDLPNSLNKDHSHKNETEQLADNKSLEDNQETESQLNFVSELKEPLRWSFNGSFRQRVISVFSQPFND
jgi:superfamily II DNA or RNA helicase